MIALHQPTLRVVKILETLKNKSDGLNITQLSKDCSISVGTLHPILKTLCELNYLNYDSKNYKLAFNLNPKIEQEKTIKIIIFYMDKLASKIKFGVQLGMLNGKKVIYLHKSEGNGKIIIKTKAGDLANANSTALGKALLLECSKNDLKKIFGNDKLEKNTHNTIDNIDDLYKNIDDSKKLGYTFENGEYDVDFACFAVPIYKQGKIFAAISITILNLYLNDELKSNIVKNLLEYKKIIENEI
ncbi:IclR family transcriptional regulator [Campylobacter sp. MG1]|uniref:IclR family transcriptional regulator n=1 Tax=Campylobacter sp. MG1 TaxID=2976332 RepID=UPI00226C8956|nr:IclR family transcriptional regulator C-terminal domain-containing protein [Campylobacter sp. MG1]